jgi:predicted amidohydrolase
MVIYPEKKKRRMLKMIKPYVAACIQPFVHMCQTRGDIMKNLDRYNELIDYTVGFYWEGPCKLIAFPEYFLQGVTTPGKGEKRREQFLDVAIEIPGEETAILGEKAKEYGIYIAGGGIVETLPDFPGHWFNTGVIIGPTGDLILKYHKWHIPAYLGLGTSPQDVFDRYKELYGGDLKSLFPVADTEIGKLGIFICYDGYSPEVTRALAFNGGEVLIHPTAVPGARIEGVTDTWTLTNRARAHDNMVYVVAPDWGRVEYKYYPENFCPGRSQIVDYTGRIIAESPYPGESVIGARIDIETLRQRRAMVTRNTWPDLRAEIFKEIYEHPIHPPNLFLENPPESLSQKIEGEIQGFTTLYERGTLTRPGGDVKSIEERLREAQAKGTLKK